MLAPVAIALAVTAVVVIWLARRPRGTLAKCQTCATVLVPGAWTNETVLMCPVCHVYSAINGDQLVRVSDGYLASTPAFGCAMPTTEIHWPTGCCVCEQPATRTVEIKLVEKNDSDLVTQVAVRSLSLGAVKAVDVTTFTLEVPHCAQHADGAALARVSGPAYRPGGPAIGERMLADRDRPALGVGFRSYAYFEKFAAANHAVAQPLS